MGAARFALVEKPAATADSASAFYPLREIVHRLQGQIRQSTRLTNQLHNLLARAFPELALPATAPANVKTLFRKVIPVPDRWSRISRMALAFILLAAE